MSDTLPSHAQAVIVGGGIAGANLAYHLAKRGWRDVVILERQQLSSGTTWHSAGNVTRLVTGLNTMRHHAYAGDLYSRLEAETGQHVGWRECGRVILARTEARVAELHRLKTTGRALGIDMHIISPREVEEKVPVIQAKDAIGAIWCPSDGRVNATDLLAALIKSARQGGLRVFENTGVTGFRTKGGRVTGVVTDKGEIATEVVINCAGLWGRQIGAMAGVTVPLYAVEHFYLLTKPIPGVKPDMPTFRDPDGLIYGREDVGGLLAGCFDKNAKALPLERIPTDFSFSLLNEDWDQFEPYMETAIKRIPALETAEVRMLLNGPESFTPDGNPIVGEAPGLRGYFVMAGMNSAGVTSTASIGRALADWIVEGHPCEDLSDLDLRRFGDFHGGEAFLKTRVSEIPSFHFFIHDAGHDFQNGRDMRLSPLHGRLAARGAHSSSAFGWERPTWFGENGKTHAEATATECHAAANGVALFDRTSLGKALVQGPDAGALLQSLCANDVSLAPGEARATAFLDARGHVAALPVIVRLDGDSWLVLSAAEQTTRDRDWIARHAPATARVAVSDASAAWGALGLRGPAAGKLLASLGGEPRNSGPVELGYAPVRAVKDAFGDDWLLLTPTEFAAGLYDSIVAADLAPVLAGSLASEALRLADGRPAWGLDVTDQTHALSASLGDLVDAKKRETFLGSSALVVAKPPATIRRTFTVAGDGARPQAAAPILLRNKVIGTVTSAAWAPHLDRMLVMAQVPARAGAGLVVDAEGQERALEPR
ncbi:MAG: FAD-dependent oxidoreductase [Alphaproteobacteria bacterium]|nr:FAD-dependent oxidoreductase [Alphaproteobacteria bacterium]